MNNDFSPNNSIYLRRRSRIVLPEGAGADLPLSYAVSVARNLEALGFTLSEPLIRACQTLSLEQLTALYRQLVTDLRAARGAHRAFRPMYPDFPQQVMAMGESELYLNALVHYVTGGKWLPPARPKLRLPLRDKAEPKVIELGTREEFEGLFTQIASSNAALSEQDREDLTWFVSTYGDGIERLLPEAIPQKENIAFLAGLLIAHTTHAEAFLGRYCKTATDVLRLAVALSGGDVSLAKPTKFRSFKRPERRLLLGLLEGRQNLTEDMLRWRGRWVRLGERLHPGEHRAAFPKTAAAFAVLRDGLPFETFNGRVEKALAVGDAAGAVGVLASRAGDFARRLDHVLRLDPPAQAEVVAAFAAVAEKVSTPVLLQVRAHFQSRPDPPPLRVFFLKGNVAKAHVEENALPPLSEGVCAQVAGMCAEALGRRFSALAPLGRVYVDPRLADYTVPFATRSASKSFRTVGRGSRLPLPMGCQVLRFFVWWHNGEERTDIDLSAAMFDADFALKDLVSYYSLKGYGGVHSGDIVDAPEGASEFIDVTLARVREQGVRYIVMVLQSFTQQPYADLPECFAGWMARQEPGSGEVYDPRTVEGRLDLTADTRVAIPLIFDVLGGTAVWCDMALRSNPKWQNNVHGNLSGIAVTLQSLVSLKKPNLYDLFVLHAQARGRLVDSPNAADVVFSVENGTPFRQEEIASEYLA